MLVDAVGALQRGDTSLATIYLQFTEQHRGREVAERAKESLRRYQRAEKWADCHLWPAWDYRRKPPDAPPPVTGGASRPKAKKRRRV